MGFALPEFRKISGLITLLGAALNLFPAIPHRAQPDFAQIKKPLLRFAPERFQEGIVFPSEFLRVLEGEVNRFEGHFQLADSERVIAHIKLLDVQNSVGFPILEMSRKIPNLSGGEGFTG